MTGPLDCFTWVRKKKKCRALRKFKRYPFRRMNNQRAITKNEKKNELVKRSRGRWGVSQGDTFKTRKKGKEDNYC